MLNSFATLLCKKIAGIMCETRLTKTPLLRTEPRGPGSRTPAGRNCRDARKQLVVIRNFRYFRWSQTNILLYSFLTCRETIVFLCKRKDNCIFMLQKRRHKVLYKEYFSRFAGQRRAIDFSLRKKPSDTQGASAGAVGNLNNNCPN